MQGSIHSDKIFLLRLGLPLPHLQDLCCHTRPVFLHYRGYNVEEVQVQDKRWGICWYCKLQGYEQLTQWSDKEMQNCSWQKLILGVMKSTKNKRPTYVNCATYSKLECNVKRQTVRERARCKSTLANIKMNPSDSQSEEESRSTIYCS